MSERDSQTTSVQVEAPSGKRLIVSFLATLVGAAVILLVVVLPAEYQIDPTGLGGLIGLDRLRGGALTDSSLNPAPVGLAVSHDEAFQVEEKLLELRPQEEMELKIAMDEGDTLVYSWVVEGGSIYSDFHAEPYGEPEGGAIRYEESEETASEHGTLNSPFAGHHGWYWVNANDFPVQVRLKVSGFYAVIKERRAS